MRRNRILLSPSVMISEKTENLLSSKRQKFFTKVFKNQTFRYKAAFGRENLKSSGRRKADREVLF